MKKYLIAISCLSISAYAIAKERPSLEYNFPVCGQSILNEKNITKVCATRDFTALEPRKRKRNWLAFLAAEGSGKYYGPIDRVGGILEFKNQELDMQGHVWDFSKQGNSGLTLKGHDSIIRNGIILNTSATLGGGYIPPNFSTGEQKNNDVTKYGFLYAKEYSSVAYQGSIENFYFKDMKFTSYNFNLRSYGGGVFSSQFILKNRMNVYGSKATILNNKIISDAGLGTDDVCLKNRRV